ncbi:hypothetical protein LCGC14_2919520, partial [marine sediment metagenome]
LKEGKGKIGRLTTENKSPEIYTCDCSGPRPDFYKYEIDKNTDFSNFQTIGNPGEWNFIPKENQAKIAGRRDDILALIKEKNIYMEERKK